MKWTWKLRNTTTDHQAMEASVMGTEVDMVVGNVDMVPTVDMVDMVVMVDMVAMDMAANLRAG